MTQPGNCIKQMIQAETEDPTFRAAEAPQPNVGRSPHPAGVMRDPLEG